MKKLFLIFTLTFMLHANEENSGEKIIVEEWQIFAGFEGGLGLYSIFPSMHTYTNGHLNGEKPLASSLGYNFGFSFGWQKYSKLMLGHRTFFSLRIDYAPHYKGYDNTPYAKRKAQKKVSLGQGYGFTLMYGNDWFFDFYSTEKERQGIIIGLASEITSIQFFQKSKGSAIASLGVVPRIGYKIQRGNTLFDIVLSIPIGGFVSTGSFENDKVSHALVGTTLTAGYKQLF